MIDDFEKQMKYLGHRTDDLRRLVNVIHDKINGQIRIMHTDIVEKDKEIIELRKALAQRPNEPRHVIGAENESEVGDCVCIPPVIMKFVVYVYPTDGSYWTIGTVN